MSELLQEQHTDFVSSMARIMATVLVTTKELFQMRLSLRKLQTKVRLQTNV